MANSEPQQGNIEDLVRLFESQINDGDQSSNVCFFLGAGASVSSGIKSGYQMAKEWFYELKPEKAETLTIEVISKEDNGLTRCQEVEITKDNLGEMYSVLYVDKFKMDSEGGLRYLQKEIEGKTPGPGYQHLAQILCQGKHNIVITTNFDRLLEDALFNYSDKAPLVCAHESLSKFVNHHQSRPVVIKLHHDLLFSPKSTSEELQLLPKEFGTTFSSIITDHALLVIGYGGHDVNVMKFLEDIKPKKRKPIYWCYINREDIHDGIKNLLAHKDFLIEIKGFDQLLEALAQVYRIKPFHTIKEVEEMPSVQRSIVRALALIEPGTKNSYIKNAKNAYKRASKSFKSPHILHKRALFLEKTGHYKKSRRLHRKAIKREPLIAEYHYAFAKNLFDYPSKHHHKKLAGKHFLTALSTDKGNAKYNFGYANYLARTSKNKKAYEFFKKSLVLDKYNPEYNYGFADFLQSIGNDLLAREHFELAIEFAHNKAKYCWGYANFLLNNQGDSNKANIYYSKVIKEEDDKEEGEKDASLYVEYASFLLLTNNDHRIAMGHLLTAQYLIQQRGEPTLELEFLLHAYAPHRHPSLSDEAMRHAISESTEKMLGNNFHKHINKLKAENAPIIKKLSTFAESVKNDGGQQFKISKLFDKDTATESVYVEAAE